MVVNFGHEKLNCVVEFRRMCRVNGHLVLFAHHQIKLGSAMRQGISVNLIRFLPQSRNGLLIPQLRVLLFQLVLI